ncbi:MAG TPA: HEAT repeat domain-containing protein [Candidatus Dormibacteraeota bacterium]|nr:HEAT repeat domain-containing protein [Candidatus Dormibacteraeota bacterium]
MAAARKAGLNPPVGGRRLTADESDRALALTRDPEPRVRQAALMNLCPCHLRTDRPEVWERVFELAADPDVHVRKQVLHTLGDGSPRRLEDRVIATLESMRQDPDGRLRRNVRRLLAQYRRTGRVNVL